MAPFANHFCSTCLAARQWVNVGTVVDSAGSSGRKVEYQGKEYDFVFDVDIEDGKPPLKLPYNLNENPYERARKFLEDNELPLSYLDNVVQFIEQNTKGATLGETGGGGAPDPYGSDARYKPGDEAKRVPKVLPHGEYLSILAAKHEGEFKSESNFIICSSTTLYVLTFCSHHQQDSQRQRHHDFLRPQGRGAEP